MHIPVLEKEVLEYLDPKPNENFIDCTLGNGGHSLAILEKISPNGKVLGIDSDSEQIKRIRNQELEKKLILVCDNFVNLKEIVEKYKFKPVQGILFDLGMSSWHLEESGRGFSFLRNESLDMRYNPESRTLTAEEIINSCPEQEIDKILKEYGEEKFSKKIAEEIVNSRKLKPIKTTFQLVEIIKKAVPNRYQHKKINPATRTFQALRIAVNNELANLEKALPAALEILTSEGKLAVISFHSLEDRIAKNFFKNQAGKGLIKILTKKPIRPLEKEIKINPRSRSAKLRVAIKII